MKNPRETHTFLMARIKNSIKEEMKFEIGKTTSGATFFYNDFTVYSQQQKIQIEFCVCQKKMYFMGSENLGILFDDIFLKRNDIKELDELYNEKGNWFIFLSLVVEVVSEISIPNFEQTKEYKLRSLYDKNFEQLFNNLSCLYVDKINKYCLI